MRIWHRMASEGETVTPEPRAFVRMLPPPTTPKEETLLRLPPGSWVSDYHIFYRVPLPDDGGALRVAVDLDSYDYQRLTDLEFAGQPLVFRATSFVQFSRLIEHGDVDAILWSGDQMEAYPDPEIRHRPLSRQVMDLVGEKSVSAAFVARAGSDALRAMLKSTLKREDVMEIQRKVIDGEMIPEY